MSGRLVPAITVIALLVLLLALMVLGWRARRRRQRALPEPPRLPAGLGAPTFEVDVLYVATTTAGEPLDRLTVAPLGFRGRAAARVHDAGLVLAIDGEREVLVPLTASRDPGSRPTRSTASWRRAAWWPSAGSSTRRPGPRSTRTSG
ncbi:hypothetical protein BC477_12995 [Clavibacter michiganensis subsp. michiganensis]|uniref:PH domain-containing protein n=1 Tax=Clavibacter michiganensis subsp. michiganensis TaxID=33013 RepID=A0A251XIS7_CLAMM|nr:hypothetical protein BC477_12995 [Clavibacter michiganensis subsp. michiganensis]OUE02712.1 hypothetical protein CMMCAS07_11900 [Clavibacter michiganensis subsp. michiganensis]